MAYNFASARDLFEATRDAAEDAVRCQRQMDAMERRAAMPGSTSLVTHVSGGAHDRIAERVASLVDREAELQSRMEQDYALVDLAFMLLYGSDADMGDGLASIAPAWWADAIDLHYIELMPWREVGELVGYSESHVKRAIRAAFELMDANGMIATIEGRGGAEV